MTPSRLFILARLALKSLSQNWRHSLATSLAILGGFAAVSLFDGFLQAIREYNEDRYVHKGMTGHVIVEKTGSAEHVFEDVWGYSLSLDEQKKLAAILDGDSRVVTTMRYLMVSGLMSNGRTSALFIGSGFEVAPSHKIRGSKWDWNTIAGKPLEAGNTSGSLIVGMGLADRMGCEYDHEIKLKSDGSYLAEPRELRCPGTGLQLSVTTEHAQVNALTVPVAGVTDMQLREFNDKVLAMPLAAAQQLFDTDRITRQAVLLQSSDQIPAFLRDFRARAKAANLDVEAMKWVDHPVAALARGGLEVMGVFRGLFLVVVAVIASMSVANSMMKSINERIREIGTLRSFGFRRSDIVMLFSLEGLFLGFFSCLGGIVFTTMLAGVLTHLGITFKAGLLSTPMPLMFSMAFSLWLTTAAALSLITFFTSWLVAQRAARMVIADALRHTA